jgi:NADPH-dependent methylglyoxal reductase
VHVLAKSHPHSKLSFVHVREIAADRAYDQVFKSHKEITAVIHTASPFNFSADDL